MVDNILSLILFGSYSRKDNDPSSDLDLCVITRDSIEHEIKHEDIKELISSYDTSSVSLVSYTDSLIDTMLNYGSLFLWHLKLEGQVLFGEEYFKNKLRFLKPFKSHYDEVLYHSEMYEDVLNCWKTLSIPNELDLSILFTLTRNTCMILSHKYGKPSFGRLNSFVSAKEVFPDLPMSIDEYIHLSLWKILYERDFPSIKTLPSSEEYNIILLKVDGVLKYALRRLE